MDLEQLLLEILDNTDLSHFPSIGDLERERLDNIERLVARVTARISSIRRYAEKTRNNELLALLEYRVRVGQAKKS